MNNSIKTFTFMFVFHGLKALTQNWWWKNIILLWKTSTSACLFSTAGPKVGCETPKGSTGPMQGGTENQSNYIFNVF